MSEATATATGEQSDTAVLDLTLPGRLISRARERGDETAVLQKHQGIYVRYTWSEYRDAVAAVALAWRDLGVERGDTVAILSDNRVEWVLADLAAQALGAVVVGIYPTNSATEVEYVLNHAGVTHIVVEDQEQLDKVIAIRGDAPGLRRVVVIDPRGTRGYEHELLTWQELERRGEELLADHPDHFLEAVRALDQDDPAVLIYTSGTTADPKAAVWSQRVMTAQADRFVRAYGFDSSETTLSYLPLCHAAEKLFTELVALTTGCCVHFGESISTVQADTAEIGPTLFVGMPRTWEKTRASVERDLRRSSRLKRLLFAWCLQRGQRDVERRASGADTWRDRLTRRVIDLVMFRALREHLGLGRAWFVMSGGAPIGEDLLRWLHAIGVPVIESYGLTEAGVTHTVPIGSKPRIGSVGLPFDDVECRLAADGEILLRSGTNLLHYLHDDEATRQTVDEDGWVRTGDLGALDDDGWLRVVGRKKDIIITAGGKNLSPASIENALKSSPFISHAVPIGDQRPFVSALIQIDWDTVGDWAAQQQVAYTSFEDLTGKPEVVALIASEVEAANAQLARVSWVREFRLLPKQLHQDDGELTATQKVRRRAVLERFSALVDDIYSSPHSTGARS